MARYESNYTDAQLAIAVPTNVSHDMAMYGGYYKPEKDDAENGPTSSACYVVQSVVEYDGSGMPKIMYGPRSTPRCKNDGSTSMLVKRHGITQGYMLRVGERRCHTALHSLWMAQPMSLDDMYARLNMHWSEIGVQRK